MTIIRFPPARRQPAEDTSSEEALRLAATAALNGMLMRNLIERRRGARAVLDAFRRPPSADD